MACLLQSTRPEVLSRVLQGCACFSARTSEPFLSRRRTWSRLEIPLAVAAFHSASAASDPKRRAHNNEEIPDEAPITDFARMDVLGATPVPSTSIDICMADGFQLNSGVKILDGSGVLLVGGEAFAWRPWKVDRRLVNVRGQWEVSSEALGLLGLVWPRPGALTILSLPYAVEAEARHQNMTANPRSRSTDPRSRA